MSRKGSREPQESQLYGRGFVFDMFPNSGWMTPMAPNRPSGEESHALCCGLLPGLLRWLAPYLAFGPTTWPPRRSPNWHALSQRAMHPDFDALKIAPVAVNPLHHTGALTHNEHSHTRSHELGRANHCVGFLRSVRTFGGRRSLRGFLRVINIRASWDTSLAGWLPDTFTSKIPRSMRFISTPSTLSTTCPARWMRARRRCMLSLISLPPTEIVCDRATTAYVRFTTAEIAAMNPRSI